MSSNIIERIDIIRDEIYNEREELLKNIMKYIRIVENEKNDVIRQIEEEKRKIIMEIN